MLGIFFSILAAATFAFNATAARRAVLSGRVIQGLMITVPMGVPLFALLALAVGELQFALEMPVAAMGFFAAAGVVHYVIGRYFNYSAGALIGTNLATPIMQAEVLVTLVLAIVVLGEQLSALRLIGIVLVLLGPLLVFQREGAVSALRSAHLQPEGEAKAADAGGFKPRYLEGYTASALGTLAYGVSPILMGLGLAHTGGTGAIAGGLISYVAGTLAIAALLAIRRPSRQTFAIHPTAVRWFLLAGFFVFVSHACRFAALLFVPVSVMTTLQRLSSLFRIYFAWIINREHEVFDGGVIVATVVSMIGAIALSISTDVFLSLAAWPAWLESLARWRWP